CVRHGARRGAVDVKDDVRPGLCHRNVMEIRIRQQRDSGSDDVDRDRRQEQLSVGSDTESVAASAVRKERGVRGGCWIYNHRRSARASYPGVDGEVLQLERRSGRKSNTVSVTIEEEGLTDFAGGEYRIADDRAVVAADAVIRVPLGVIGGDDAGRCRCACWCRRRIALAKRTGVV